MRAHGTYHHAWITVNICHPLCELSLGFIVEFYLRLTGFHHLSGPCSLHGITLKETDASSLLANNIGEILVQCWHISCKLANVTNIGPISGQNCGPMSLFSNIGHVGTTLHFHYLYQMNADSNIPSKHVGTDKSPYDKTSSWQNPPQSIAKPSGPSVCNVEVSWSYIGWNSLENNFTAD